MAADDAEQAVIEARRLAAQRDERLQAAVDLLLPRLGEIPESGRPAASRILWRAGYYEAAASLGDVAEIGRLMLAHEGPENLLFQLGRVESEADRLEVIREHRAFGERFENLAAQRPIAPPKRDARERLRLGFISSDLRHHVVAWFVQPVLEHIDPRFEVFCYSSFAGPPDLATQWMAGRAKAFRLLPSDDHYAAAAIAADDLDMLIDLSGPTYGNRPGVLAYKPAALQASWIGYPLSPGLSTLDAYIADPYLAPPRRELLMEAPLLMPASWLCMAPSAFQAEPGLQPEPPLRQKGVVTFGTAADPYKFNPRLVRSWARILAAVPGSRFMLVRPEAAAAGLRENLAGLFAEEGVGAERLDFRPIRGAVRQAYAEIDIALDTFPLTGGVTTCEAFWMGVPSVTLVGEATYERLGFSILSNLGLADLAAETIADYERIAVGLANSPERLAEIRRTARERVRSRPIGRPAEFAADFYEMIAGAVAQAR